MLIKLFYRPQNILQIRGQDEDPLSERAQEGGRPEERLLLQLFYDGIRESACIFIQLGALKTFFP